MVASLAAVNAISLDDQDCVAAAVLKREELATTGIGRGIAIPHTKHSAVTKLVATIAYAPAGVDFDALDGEPVHLMILVISPPGESREHLLALEAVSRWLLGVDHCSWRDPRRHADD